MGDFHIHFASAGVKNGYVRLLGDLKQRSPFGSLISDWEFPYKPGHPRAAGLPPIIGGMLGTTPNSAFTNHTIRWEPNHPQQPTFGP